MNPQVSICCSLFYECLMGSVFFFFLPSESLLFFDKEIEKIFFLYCKFD
jgi:hypothetical protein